MTEAGDYFLADAVIAATGDADVFAPSRVANVTCDVELTFKSASARGRDSEAGPHRSLRRQRQARRF